MASTLIRKVLLKINSDDGDTEEKLQRISDKADELARKHPDIDVKVRSAEASAKLKVLREELKHTADEGRKAKDMGGKFGVIGRLLFGSGGEGGEGGGGGLAGMLSSLGGSMSGGSLAKMVLLIPAIEAAAVEATGLASGFAAAGAGVGAFALLAMPAFDKIKTAYTNINAAQLAYNQATTAAARSTALKHIHDDWKALDPAERGALRGVDKLRESFGKMSKAFEPAAFKVFDQVLKIANELLPHLKPFADTAATALDGLLKQVAKFADSSGFRDWLKQFQKLEGPSIKAIGHGIGEVAIAIGKLLTTMSKKDVVNSINIAFTVLTDTIRIVANVVHNLMQHWDELVIAAGRVNSALAHSATDFVNWAGNVHAVVSRVVAYFEALPGRIRSGLSNVASMLFSIGKNAILGLVHGIESMFGSVEGAVKHLAGLIPSTISHLLSIFSPSRVTYYHGQMIGQGLISGMDSMHGAVSAASARMAGAAGLHGGSIHGGAAGGGQVLRVQLEWAGGGNAEGDFDRWLRNNIRAKGGNVQRVYGH